MREVEKIPSDISLRPAIEAPELSRDHSDSDNVFAEDRRRTLVGVLAYDGANLVKI